MDVDLSWPITVMVICLVAFMLLSEDDHEACSKRCHPYASKISGAECYCAQPDGTLKKVKTALE